MIIMEFESDSGKDLAHYGVLGMKWGVRRYQNEDGSLKPAGEKHYSNGSTSNKNRMKSNSGDSAVTKKVKSDYNKMSDKEFRQKYSVSKKTYEKRVSKSVSGDPFKDNRASMQKTKLGSKMYDASTNAEVKQLSRLRLNDKANNIQKQKSTGAKILNRVLLGKSGTATYNRLQASGYSKKGAAAITVLLGGRAGDHIAESRYMNKASEQKKMKRDRSLYYE